MIGSKRVALFLASSTIAMTAGVANAQVDVIVVTAQKKEENLQDVPIAISALPEEALSKSGVYNADTLTQVVPGLQVGRQIGAITPYLRGVGTQQTAAGDESSIATYVDGVYRISLYSGIQSFNNIERIEVLKGPQGTLFGRNATGGLMHIITKDPSHDASGKLSAFYGNYERFGAGFYGTTGISDSAAIDLSVTYSDQKEGYGVNLFTGSDVNKSKEFAIRSKLVWEPGDSTKVTISGDYVDLKSSISIARQLAPGALGVDGQIIFGGCVAGLGGIPTAPTPVQASTCAPIAAAGATVNTGDFYSVNSNLDPFYETEVFGGHIKIDHSFGGVGFVSLTSYRETDTLQVLDQEGSVLAVINAPLETKTDAFQQELRLESTYDSPLQWIIGAYYLSSMSAYDNFNLSGFGVAGLVPGAIAYRAFPMQDTTSVAGFAQAYWQITDQLQITAGIRLTYDKREFTSSNEVLFGTAGVDPFLETVADFRSATFTPIPVNATGALVTNQSESWTEPTWRAALDYQATDNILIYASYSRGFKSGVFNLANSAGPGPVNPEILDAYEIGFKSELFDRYVRVNGSGYYYDYQDLQLSSVAAGSTVLLNAAEATVWGAELDILSSPTDNLDLRFSIAYVDSEYTSFPNAPFFFPTGFGGSVATVGDAAGNRLNRAPVLTLSAGGNYTVDTGLGEISIYGNIYYNDGFFWTPQNVVAQDPYTLINAGISLAITDTVKVRFQADNILDEEYSYYDDNSTLESILTSAAPRTYRGVIELSF
jgi:iron complex outermembrane recepter protein